MKLNTSERCGKKKKVKVCLHSETYSLIQPWKELFRGMLLQDNPTAISLLRLQLQFVY